VRVLIIPGLSWADVSQGRMPVLARMASAGAVANVAVAAADDPSAQTVRSDVNAAAGRLPVRADVVGEIVGKGAARERAARAADGAIRAGDPAEALVVVGAPVVAGSSAFRDLAPLVVYGAGADGYLSAPSVRRAGLVLVSDLPAIAQSCATGALLQQFSLAPAPSDSGSRIERLARFDVTQRVVDSLRMRYITLIAVVIALALSGSLLVLRFAGSMSAPMRRVAAAVARAAMLLPVALFSAAWLQFVFVAWPQSARGFVLAYGLTVAGLWAVLAMLTRVSSARIAIVVAAGSACVLWLVDQWLGAPLSAASAFGYSIREGLRFYGMGNESAAMLVAASLVALAALLDERPGDRLSVLLRRWGVPLVAVVVVATSALPMLGANVGAAIWGTVAFAVTWALLNGVRATPLRIALLLGAVVVVVAALAAIDLSSGGGTHFAQFLRGGDLGALISSKLTTSFRVLTTSPLSVVAIALIALMGYLRWRPRGRFALALSENPALGSVTTALLWSGLLAWATEDSGFVMPAFMVMWLGIAWLSLMLQREEA
jgi:hypothetical protein